ncbi:hypothetical protein [Nocardia ninae]|uniref:Uncharacterized protein n=1 Tax=Nocardia ninae NBRC 108245 TaxID=1210091 RepID=A0A511MHV7_9NOCA|nr:hypothetical protein [Nocardia ninae]GEM40169.1 hypothetical protein NN4_46880 [Nocardia ninae NBRC 108245]
MLLDLFAASRQSGDDGDGDVGVGVEAPAGLGGVDEIRWRCRGFDIIQGGQGGSEIWELGQACVFECAVCAPACQGPEAVFGEVLDGVDQIPIQSGEELGVVDAEAFGECRAGGAATPGADALVHGSNGRVLVRDSLHPTVGIEEVCVSASIAPTLNWWWPTCTDPVPDIDRFLIYAAAGWHLPPRGSTFDVELIALEYTVLGKEPCRDPAPARVLSPLIVSVGSAEISTDACCFMTGASAGGW